MKKKLIGVFLFLIIIFLVVFIIILFHKSHKVPNTFEITKEFKINKVIYYSSANAISNTTNYQNPEWNLKVYQFTDIAIYIDRINSGNLHKYQNYITQILLENFETSSSNAKVYYLNPKNFGNSNLTYEDLIDNSLEYTLINSENKEDTQNYNIPIFFQDCSNPITFRIVTELSDSYKISNDHTLSYNGSLIKDLGFGIDNLNKSISFDLMIDTKGPGHIQTINLDIPYESKERSILDGDFKEEVETNLEF